MKGVEIGVDRFDQVKAEAIDLLRNAKHVVLAVGDESVDSDPRIRVSPLIAPAEKVPAIVRALHALADKLENQ